MNIITAIKKREIKSMIGYAFLFAATLLAVGELILYLTTGKTQFNADLPVGPIVFLSIGIVLGAGSLLFTVRACIFGQFLCLLSAFVLYIVSQISYIVNVIDSRDGIGLSTALIIALVIGGLAFIFALVASILIDRDVLSQKFLNGEVR